VTTTAVSIISCTLIFYLPDSKCHKSVMQDMKCRNENKLQVTLRCEGCERARDRSQNKKPTQKCLQMRTISFGICAIVNSVQLRKFCVSGTPEILKEGSSPGQYSGCNITSCRPLLFWVSITFTVAIHSLFPLETQRSSAHLGSIWHSVTYQLEAVRSTLHWTTLKRKEYPTSAKISFKN